MRPRSRQRPERVRPRLNDLASRPYGPRGLNIPDEYDIAYMYNTHFIFSLVSNSNLNSPTIVVQKWTQLEHSRLKSIDKLPLLSLAYMFNRGGRPNLLAIIVAQKAQSIQRSVTEARTNLCTQYTSCKCGHTHGCFRFCCLIFILFCLCALFSAVLTPKI